MTIDMTALWPQFQSLLEAQGAQFIAGHTADVAILGEDVAKAILSTAISDHLQTMVTPGADAVIDTVMSAEAVLASRTAALQLIAVAEAQHEAAVAALRQEALKVAEALGMTLLTVVGGTVIKTVGL